MNESTLYESYLYEDEEEGKQSKQEQDSGSTLVSFAPEESPDENEGSTLDSNEAPPDDDEEQKQQSAAGKKERRKMSYRRSVAWAALEI